MYLPASEVCLCPPEFVNMFKVAGEDRWVLGRRLAWPPASVDETYAVMSEEDAFEYLAGNYSEWAIHCAHCGLLYTDGAPL